MQAVDPCFELEKILQYSLDYGSTLLGRSPAFLTSDDIVRSNEIVKTKWPIY